MNPYLQALAAADADRQSHYQRAAEQTRTHFARHPECRRLIVSMDADGNPTRVKGEIDVEARCQPGWFHDSMWRGNYYEAARPVEAVVEGVEEKIWIGVKRGHAIEVHKFMRWYLAGQTPALPELTRTPAPRQRAALPPVTALASAI